MTEKLFHRYAYFCNKCDHPHELGVACNDPEPEPEFPSPMLVAIEHIEI